MVLLLRFGSGGFVYSRVEVGEEEIFLAPTVRSLAPGSSGPIMYSRRLEVWINLCGSISVGRRGGEEEERTRGGDWKRGEEEVRGGGEGREGVCRDLRRRGGKE